MSATADKRDKSLRYSTIVQWVPDEEESEAKTKKTEGKTYLKSVHSHSTLIRPVLHNNL